jgi:hypothetical protein
LLEQLGNKKLVVEMQQLILFSLVVRFGVDVPAGVAALAVVVVQKEVDSCVVVSALLLLDVLLGVSVFVGAIV